MVQNEAAPVEPTSLCEVRGAPRWRQRQRGRTYVCRRSHRRVELRLPERLRKHQVALRVGDKDEAFSVVVRVFAQIGEQRHEVRIRKRRVSEEAQVIHLTQGLYKILLKSDIDCAPVDLSP